MKGLFTTIRKSARTFVQGLSELVFPPACAGCGRTLSTDEGEWCRPCATELLEVTPKSYCPRCGVSIGEYMFDETGCSMCRETGVRPTALVRVGTYHDLAGLTLRRFKFNREHRLDACLAGLLASALQGQAWHREIDALVPVPTTWRGRLRYRCWPTWLLAMQVGRRLGLPAIPVLYVKGKRRPQVGLPESSRPANVRGVFHVHTSARLAGSRLCIIDDVSTTGATLQEITRVLLKGGAASIYAAVIAKTDRGRGDA